MTQAAGRVFVRKFRDTPAGPHWMLLVMVIGELPLETETVLDTQILDGVLDLGGKARKPKMNVWGWRAEDILREFGKL